MNTRNVLRPSRTVMATLLAVGIVTAHGEVAAKERILQLAEDTAMTKAVTAPRATPLASAPVTRICEPGAQWIRVGFTELNLDAYDSLTLVSSGGDRYTFEAKHWDGRAFHTRALRGECVEVEAQFGAAGSRYTIDRYDFGMRPLAESAVIVAGAGDICDSSGSACAGTSDLIVAINPTAVFTAGDNAYSSGTLTEYNNRYAPTWGRFKTLTNPTPGNHDYLTSNASGYFDYFNGVGVQTGPAGDRSKGYYSWDAGDWHFIALNTMSGGTVATAQLNWLQADLAANTKPCTAAYWHHPLVSRGNYTGYSQVKPFWDALYAAKADLVLVGHDHNYQRYAKMNPSQAAAADGIRQVLVGTGGRAFYPLSGSHALLERSNANTYGVLKLTLTATGYTGEFVPRAGGTFTDTFSGTCNKAGTPPTNAPPVANFSFAANGLAVTFTDASTDSDGTVASRAWNFGDGTTSTATSPGKTYAAAGTYTVTLTATDDDGASHAVSKSVTVATSGGTALQNGVPATGLGAASGQSLDFTFAVPAGASALKFDISGGTGDADMYVRYGTPPTTSTYDCRPYKTGNAEACPMPAATAGTWHVRLNAFKTFAGVSLKAGYSTTSPGTSFENTTDYTIADNATVDSPITVSGIAGNAPATLAVSVAIVHSYRGDLKVDLVAPDGTLYNLHNRSGGSADDLVATYTVNASSEVANGVWKLRVNDNAAGDTGRIDRWSLQF